MDQQPKQYSWHIEFISVGLLTNPVDNGMLPYQRNQGKRLIRLGLEPEPAGSNTVPIERSSLLKYEVDVVRWNSRLYGWKWK